MDPTPLPHAAMAASIVLGIGLRMAQHRQQATASPRGKGLLALLTLTALLTGVGVAVWSGNWTALSVLDPDACSLVLVDVAAWVLGVATPMLQPPKTEPP